MVSEEHEESDQRETELVCEEAEWFPGQLKFTLLGAMSSCLLAVDTDGKLHEWSWDSDTAKVQQVS